MVPLQKLSSSDADAVVTKSDLLFCPVGADGGVDVHSCSCAQQQQDNAPQRRVVLDSQSSHLWGRWCWTANHLTCGEGGAGQPIISPVEQVVLDGQSSHLWSR
ncbi:hypothetical protein FHG87_015425 [Trinorchestia longiramus]|nr:hypothetical protein FHG87_015425 [Trinorchestia longiramus]